MIAIYIIIAFIFGVIFSLVGIPKLTTISEIIYQKAEATKSKLNIDIAKNNLLTKKLDDQIDKSNNSTHAIGFDYVSDQNEFEDEDNEDEDCEYHSKNSKIFKSNRKVGF